MTGDIIESDGMQEYFGLWYHIMTPKNLPNILIERNSQDYGVQEDKVEIMVRDIADFISEHYIGWK